MEHVVAAELPEAVALLDGLEADAADEGSRRAAASFLGIGEERRRSCPIFCRQVTRRAAQRASICRPAAFGRAALAPDETGAVLLHRLLIHHVCQRIQTSGRRVQKASVPAVPAAV